MVGERHRQAVANGNAQRPRSRPHRCRSVRDLGRDILLRFNRSSGTLAAAPLPGVCSGVSISVTMGWPYFSTNHLGNALFAPPVRAAEVRAIFFGVLPCPARNQTLLRAIYCPSVIARSSLKAGPRAARESP